jgi:peroxiredoxin
MKMKKLIGLLAFCLIVVTACKNNDKFTIEGKFENAVPQSKIYLFGMEKSNAVAIDSTVLSDNGEFKFTRATKGVDFFKVAANEKEYVIIAKNGDQIKLSADLNDQSMSYNLSGAEEADKLQTLNTFRNKYTAKMNAIQAKFEQQVESQPDKREAIAAQLRPELAQVSDEMVNFILKFANENPKSLTSFYAMNSLNPADYEKEFIEYSDKIKSNFNDNQSVTDFLVRMAKLKSVQIGQMAPAFTMNSIDGKTISLADFKGKYVLLDFWASWCMPCRQENPNVVKAYNTYKDKNFTVFSVSLDKDPKAWAQAVAADKLTWAHGSELKDFEGPTVRLYQVEAIPSSFILNPEGKIVAKNLRGAELDAFLAKTLR